MSNVTVFFVGMHNKLGRQPLDSRTMTGKVIDRIIIELPCKCIKTNLCDTDEMPRNQVKIYNHVCNWFKVNAPKPMDLVVLLGTWVQSKFVYNRDFDRDRILKLGHPAGVFGTKNTDEYIIKAVESIIHRI